MSQGNTLDRLSTLGTNTVSDALDFLGLEGATYGLRPLWDCPKIVGRASTVLLGPETDAVTTDDRILVVSGGTEGVSCWGDIVANASKAKHIRGTIIDGMSRDIDGSREVSYPIYGQGTTMISDRNRLVQVEAGKPLQMRGVIVHQDDYVVADTCGTVFVTAKRIAEVLELGERIDRRQNLMVRAVRSGRPVSAVMHDSQFEAIREETPSLLTANAAAFSK